MRPCYPLKAGKDYIQFPHCDCQIPAREGRHCRDKGAQQCLIGKQILAADWREIPTNRKGKRRAGPLARLIKPAAGWEQSREGLSCACPAMITPGCLHAMTSNVTIKATVVETPSSSDHVTCLPLAALLSPSSSVTHTTDTPTSWLQSLRVWTWGVKDFRGNVAPDTLTVGAG